MQEPATDLQAVALAYRRGMIEWQWDHPAFDAAVVVLRQRHPGIDRDEAAQRVSELVGRASQVYGAWLYGKEDSAPPLREDAPLMPNNRNRNIALVRQSIERSQGPDVAMHADLIARSVVEDLARDGYEILSQQDLNEMDETPRFPGRD